MKPVILCDEQGNELGEYGKLEAHQDNKLHKAFSIVIYNSQGEMLIHRRALGKYHTPGLWTNACCSHDIPGEDLAITAPRRLQEEMGFTCTLEERFTFLYQAQLGEALYEHELDRVFTGIYNGPIDQYSLKEVSNAKWVTIDQLVEEIVCNPQDFTPWFIEIISRLHQDKC